MQKRIAEIREKIKESNWDALLVMRPENRYFLSGFTGTSAALFIDLKRALLLTDFRYQEQAQQESPDYEIVLVNGSMFGKIAEIARQNQTVTLACEGDFLTYQQFLNLKNKLGEIVLSPQYGLIESQRLVKDEVEIQNLRKAVDLADNAYKDILNFIKVGKSEKEISLELEFLMRRAGAEKPAFTIIVASGQRSSLPHGVASEKKIQVGDLVTMDFGAVYKGYHSDITRTVVMGTPSEKQLEIYHIVLEAQKAALAAVRAGIRAGEVDRAARDVIESYGYGKYFGHSTGHGLGLDIHENPRLAINNETILKRGMVVTVEPGIYLPGWGGIRIEDSVVVEEDGCSILTNSPKEKLLEL
ncbi:M24 family metallopeptidase [Desulfolucanica intricata]|uniref:M24 family metallopeptidase n=1 Tax=Desulfolucanica intricata TaxID=1285191 RepID=UPI00082DBCFE|nr:aminopeptidase P family protein [Desulfolucanica intricata]